MYFPCFEVVKLSFQRRYPKISPKVFLAIQKAEALLCLQESALLDMEPYPFAPATRLFASQMTCDRVTLSQSSIPSNAVRLQGMVEYCEKALLAALA